MVENPQVGQPVVLTVTKVRTQDNEMITLSQQHGRVVEVLDEAIMVCGEPSTVIRMATPEGNVIRTPVFHIRTMAEGDLETLKKAELVYLSQHSREPMYAGLWKRPFKNLDRKS